MNYPCLYHSRAGHAAMRAWYDAQLRQMPMPWESLTIATRFGATHVLTAGPDQAPPLVLLHPWNANAMVCRPLITVLSERYRLFTPDVIGMAGKSAPARLSMRGPGYARWLWEVLDALQLKRARMVGLSGGGWLILKLAALPDGIERIEQAALVSTGGIVRARLLRPAMLLEWPTIWNTILVHCCPTLKRVRRLLETIAAPGRPVEPEAVDLFYLLIKHYKNQGPPPALRSQDLAKLTAPTLLLMGQFDVFFPPAAVRARARALLPNLIAEIVPNAGHGMEPIEAVNARILRFFESQE